MFEVCKWQKENTHLEPEQYGFYGGMYLSFAFNVQDI